MKTTITEPAEETRTRFVMSYAFDVSKYADFAVYADDEDHAERIAQALLDSGTLARLLDNSAEEYDNGTENLRVFGDGEEDDDETYDTLPEIAKECGVKLPEGWENPAPTVDDEDPNGDGNASAIDAMLTEEGEVDGNDEHIANVNELARELWAVLTPEQRKAYIAKRTKAKA